VKTRTGTLIGTPVYISPEQAMGTKQVDHRSDIYSLGVILFEMICGKPPFYSEGFGELVHLHLNVQPPSPRSFVPSLPGNVEALIFKTLAKRPEDRYQSMKELQETIKALSAGQFVVKGASTPDFSNGTLPTASSLSTPVTEHPRQSTTFSTHGERLETLAPSRGRMKLVLGAVAGLVVIGGGLLLSSRRHPDTPTPPISVEKPKPALPAPIPQPVKPPDPRRVKIVIDTRPGGARVVRVDNGENLGTTPWTHEEPSGSGTLEIRLDKEGYESATYQVPLFADTERKFDLKAKAAKPPKKHTLKTSPGPEEPAKL